MERQARFPTLPSYNAFGLGVANKVTRQILRGSRKIRPFLDTGKAWG